MKYLLFILLSGFAPYAMANCSCNGTATAYYCCGTCNACAQGTQWQPINKTLHILPLTFAYSSGDKNPGNDSCGSTDCGTINCAGPTVSYSNNQLPVRGSGTAQCNYLNNNTKILPITVTQCSWSDGYCYQYCSRYCSYQYCTGYTCN